VRKLKLNATEGIVLATMILAIIGGVMTELSAYINTVDMGFLGPYKQLLLNFFVSVPFVIAVTWIYNVFNYLRQHQLAAMQNVAERFDTHKLIETLTFFMGTISPIFVLVPGGWIQSAGAFIVLVFRIVIQEIQNVFGQLQPTSPASNAAPTQSATPTGSPTPPLPQTTPEGQIGTYHGWGVYIKNSCLMVYPPSNMVATFGQMMALGSVQGYAPTTDFMSMAKTFIDQQIAQYNYQHAHPPNPAQEPQPPQPVTPAA
jgi:hypothetical protein